MSICARVLVSPGATLSLFGQGAWLTSMEPCGCKGVRSCLLCEAKGLKPLPPSFSDVPRSTFTQCHRCGELFLGAGDIIYCPVTSCTPKKIWNPCLTASGANFEGVTVVRDFVSPQEEEEAIQVIDQQRWVESQSGRRKQVCSQTPPPTSP